MIEFLSCVGASAVVAILAMVFIIDQILAIAERRSSRRRKEALEKAVAELREAQEAGRRW